MRPAKTPSTALTATVLSPAPENHGHKNVRALKSFGDLPGVLAQAIEPSDYVVMCGAGDITKHAQGLQAALEKTGGKK